MGDTDTVEVMSDGVERTETGQSVSMVTDASIPALFDFLTSPANHVRLDGSGRLVSTVAEQLTEVGETFTMQMTDPGGNRYTVENHVVEFVPDLQIAWRPARPGMPPAGPRWDWQFDVGPKGETVVTQTCDWSQADPQYLATHTLPQVSADEMRLSIKRLIDLVSSYA